MKIHDLPRRSFNPKPAYRYLFGGWTPHTFLREKLRIRIGRLTVMFHVALLRYNCPDDPDWQIITNA